MTKIYVGAWDMLPEGPVPRAEWLEAATESQIEAEIARQQSLLPSPSNPARDDMDSYRKERLMGVFSPEEFCATFNNDLHGAFNTKDYFVKMYQDGKTYVATLIERCGETVSVRATLSAASPAKLATDTVRFLDNEYEGEDSPHALYDPNDILTECLKGNAHVEPLSIEFKGEAELGHELLLSVTVINATHPTPAQLFRTLAKKIPWHTFGMNERDESLRQPLFGDLVDYLRDELGGPKDFVLAYMLLGERASKPEILWDGLPSFEGFNELLKTVNGILEKNGKRCKLSRTGFSQNHGRPRFELVCTDEEGEITGIHTLDAFECLRYAESILEEEKGILPF